MKNNSSILIVDDQPDNIRTLSGMLTGEGYNVRKALNGKMALETVHTLLPDLILLDVMMPQMNGYEVCSALKASPATRDIPVIFLSALSEISDKTQAFAVGGLDYITKPFQVQEVLLRVSHQLTIQSQRRELIKQNDRLQREIEERQRAEAVSQQQAKRERLLSEITDQIRQSLSLNEILEVAVDEIRYLLRVDQVLIFQFNSDWSGKVVAESVNSECCSLLEQTFDSLSWKQYWQALFSQEQNDVDADVYADSLQINYAELLANSQIRVSLSFPILHLDTHWGIVVAHHSFTPRAWTEWEVEFLQRCTAQLAIALHQSHLYQTTQAQVRELQKLNQLKDDFLNSISHELRTPITNIKMVIHLLMNVTNQQNRSLQEAFDTNLSNHKIAKYLEILQEECEQELRLIQDLLDLQHLEVGAQPLELIPIDLNFWLSHVIEPFESRCSRQQQTLQVELAPDLPLLTTDSFCLSRILTELLNNASKYTPAKETIIIKARVDAGTDETQEPEKSKSQKPKAKIVISVTNSGVEIPAVAINLIFDKFYRVPNHDPWNYGGCN